MHPLLRTMSKALDPDRALQVTMASLVEATGVRFALGRDKERWTPGKPLKLLLVGYVGTRNTGADVRVEEMIRQFRHVIGDENLELTIVSSDKALSAGYFRTVRQVTLPQVFPKFLFDEAPRHHGVIACEGSMFKSKFASALTCMMAGALGLANAEKKVSIGYGAEAGHMTPSLRTFVERACKQSLVICRNRPSMDVLGSMGIRTSFGTDTAWTFEPAPEPIGAQLLRAKGWDGRKKVLAICPINPFWWPVKPDLAKAAAHRFAGQFRDEHYKSVYFHHKSRENDEKYEAYIDAIAVALEAFRDAHPDVWPVLVGMEKLDRSAAEDVNARLSAEVPLFVSDEYDMYQLVSVLRSCSLMISSRFHAIVTSMPGLVASGGLTMDERIRNLMAARNHEDLFLEVDEEDLAEKTLAMMERLYRDREQIGLEIGRQIPPQLELLGQMGIDFADEVKRVYPDLEIPERPRTWQAHLPPLHADLQKLLEAHS